MMNMKLSVNYPNSGNRLLLNQVWGSFHSPDHRAHFLDKLSDMLLDLRKTHGKPVNKLVFWVLLIASKNAKIRKMSILCKTKTQDRDLPE